MKLSVEAILKSNRWTCKFLCSPFLRLAKSFFFHDLKCQARTALHPTGSLPPNLVDECPGATCPCQRVGAESC